MDTSIKEAFTHVIWYAMFAGAIWTWVVATLDEQARASIASRSIDLASAVLIGTAISFVLWTVFNDAFGNWPAGLAGMTYFVWRAFRSDKRVNRAD